MAQAHAEPEGATGKVAMAIVGFVMAVLLVGIIAWYFRLIPRP
jgi:hypothetical protein